MSFREKCAWVMGAIMIGAGLYYLSLAVAAAREIGAAPPPLATFAPFTFLIVVASVVGQAIMAILSPREANAPADERERPALDRAGAWSGLVLGFGAAASLIHFAHHQDGVLLFHLIMGSLIVSQIAEYAFQVVLLRRGV